MAVFPDRAFAGYIGTGLREGFRIGLDYGAARLLSAKRNLSSASSHTAVIDKYVAKERACGRLVGPIRPEACSRVHLSPFGVIPKSNQPGRWRLIVDLLSPRSQSVNDGILPARASLRYSRIDDAVKFLSAFRGPVDLAKIDLESAYRTIPVHPVDLALLRVRWHGDVFVDVALPFGLRSAPKIFSAVADALLWVMLRSGVSAAIHYLNDFLFMGSENPRQCAENLQQALAVCERLGVRVAHAKTAGPSPVIVFLGIEIDTVSRSLRLPQEKQSRLHSLCEGWLSRKVCSKRELLSLIGVLHHASTVIRPGRSFVRRLIDLSTSVRLLDRPLRLNCSAREDMPWWLAMAADWNGVGWFDALGLRSPSVSCSPTRLALGGAACAGAIAGFSGSGASGGSLVRLPPRKRFRFWRLQSGALSGEGWRSWWRAIIQRWLRR